MKYRGILVSALVVSLAACGSDTKTAAPPPVAAAVTAAPAAAAPVALAAGTQLIGAIGDTTTKLGLVIGDKAVWGYLCDPQGAARAVTGSLTDGTFSLKEEDGTATVTGTLTNGAFTGKVSLDGTKSYDVNAVKVTGTAGVYLAYKVVDDNTSTIGAWIRDNANDVVGNLTTIETGEDGAKSSEAGGGQPPTDAVPASLGQKFGCFQASRKLVKAIRQGASLAVQKELSDNQVRACGAAFPGGAS